MKLNHVDLQVSRVTDAREFFEKHFGFKCVYQRREELAMLEDDAGLSFGVSNLFGSPPPAYPPDFHIGFILETETEVRDIYDRLQRADVPIKVPMSRGGPNVYFMCVGPDNLTIEVRAPADAA